MQDLSWWCHNLVCRHHSQGTENLQGQPTNQWPSDSNFAACLLRYWRLKAEIFHLQFCGRREMMVCIYKHIYVTWTTVAPRFPLCLPSIVIVGESGCGLHTWLHLPHAHLVLISTFTSLSLHTCPLFNSLSLSIKLATLLTCGSKSGPFFLFLSLFFPLQISGGPSGPLRPSVLAQTYTETFYFFVNTEIKLLCSCSFISTWWCYFWCWSFFSIQSNFS